MSTLELKISNRIAEITFNRPDSLNALNLEILEALPKNDEGNRKSWRHFSGRF